jgi:hypothetical protein
MYLTLYKLRYRLELPELFLHRKGVDKGKKIVSWNKYYLQNGPCPTTVLNSHTFMLLYLKYYVHNMKWSSVLPPTNFSGNKLVSQVLHTHVGRFCNWDYFLTQVFVR